MNKEKLDEILKKHKLWLDSEGEEGEMADLDGEDLSEVDLSGVNLRSANLSGADLISANLSGANLIRADLIRTALVETNLIRTDLSGANLRGADLSGATLWDADLWKANLLGVDLRGAKGIKVCSQGGNKHILIYSIFSKGKQLQIGCKIDSIETWFRNKEPLIEQYQYTKEDVEEVENFIKYCETLKIKEQ